MYSNERLCDTMNSCSRTSATYSSMAFCVGSFPASFVAKLASEMGQFSAFAARKRQVIMTFFGCQSMHVLTR